MKDFSERLNQSAWVLQQIINDMMNETIKEGRSLSCEAAKVANIQEQLEGLALELSGGKVEIVMENSCGCVVEKHLRPRDTVYVIKGQNEGIKENPFAFNANSDEYMAQLVLNANCPHPKTRG